MDKWLQAKEAALNTVSKKLMGTKGPTDTWKKRMLLCEHSPIRLLTEKWTWKGLKSWVSVHFVRHKFGIEHFVSTQRNDRTGKERGMQDAPVNHMCVANAQAIINISRKRLCAQAHAETRAAWVEALVGMDQMLQEVCVPECVYRGFCPEAKCCGYVHSVGYEKRVREYREVK
jgi:hypothetical protein